MTQQLTKEQAAIIGAFTGKLAGPFSELHEYAERTLGRSIWSHQLADPELALELSDAARNDFVAICRTSGIPA